MLFDLMFHKLRQKLPFLHKQHKSTGWLRWHLGWGDTSKWRQDCCKSAHPKPPFRGVASTGMPGKTKPAEWRHQVSRFTEYSGVKMKNSHYYYFTSMDTFNDWLIKQRTYRDKSRTAPLSGRWWKSVQKVSFVCVKKVLRCGGITGSSRFPGCSFHHRRLGCSTCVSSFSNSQVVW